RALRTGWQLPMEGCRHRLRPQPRLALSGRLPHSRSHPTEVMLGRTLASTDFVEASAARPGLELRPDHLARSDHSVFAPEPAWMAPPSSVAVQARAQEQPPVAPASEA